MVLWILWVLTFTLQLAACLFVAQQLWSPLRYPQWLWSWGLLLTLLVSMLLQRLIWVFFHDPAAVAPLWEVGWYGLNSALACVAAVSMWRLTQPSVVLQNLEPARVSIDSTSRVTHWSSEATALFGYTAAEALGQDLTTLVMEEPYAQRHRDAVQAFLADPHPERIPTPYSTWAVDRYGRRMQVNIHIRTLRDPEGHWRFDGEVRRLIEL